MTKKGFVTLIISSIVIALVIVLFSAVFCLRTQNVTYLDNKIPVSKQDIISAANLKRGQSIFGIDKDEATNRIEQEYPEVKVVHIKTTSLTTINIIVRHREEMFYIEFDDSFYVVDEDLKVLKIVNTEPLDLVKIENDTIKISEKTKVCDFVGSKFQRQAIYNLYNAVINNIKANDTLEECYSREDIKETFTNIKLESKDSYNKIIVTTQYGVKFDIENPLKGLTNKINICLSTMRQLVEDETDNRENSGTIKIYYDTINKTQKCIYIYE